MTVFTRDGCAPCVMAKRFLDFKKVPYEVRPAEGIEYEQYAEKYGSIVPLIIHGETGILGYQPSLLSSLVKSISTQTGQSLPQ